jgi:hypothetical protein
VLADGNALPFSYEVERGRIVVSAPKKTDLSLPIKRITQDRTMSCWYAAAQVVLSYRSVAMSVVNMSTNLSTLIRYGSNQGLMTNGVNAFADEVGLHKNQAFFGRGFDGESYGIYLGKLGPLWVAGNHPQGGHVVVIAGVAADNLLLADPDPSRPFPRWMPIATFEGIRSAWNLPILYRLNAPA